MKAIFDVKRFSTFEYRGTPCVPICCYCREVRDIDGIWHKIDLPDGVELSHSYCPPCAEKHYPELMAVVSHSSHPARAEEHFPNLENIAI